MSICILLNKSYKYIFYELYCKNISYLGSGYKNFSDYCVKWFFIDNNNVHLAKLWKNK